LPRRRRVIERGKAEGAEEQATAAAGTVFGEELA
jgi:hypothetical protein